MYRGGLPAAGGKESESSSRRLGVLADPSVPGQTGNSAATRHRPRPAPMPRPSDPASRAETEAVDSDDTELRPRWMRRYQALLVVVDLAAAAIAVLIASAVRFGMPDNTSTHIA